MIVTGGASGIGIETVRALAAAGAHVTIAARRPDAAEAGARDLRAATGNAGIHVRTLDVADAASVRDFASGWDRPLHALINNAGVIAIPALERSAEGHELQFATNYLGHFALILGLHPWLKAAQGARVVSVSSTGSLYGSVQWDGPDFRFTSYDPVLAYGQSKAACILMAVGSGRKWPADGSLAMHSTPAPSRRICGVTQAGCAPPSPCAGRPNRVRPHRFCWQHRHWWRALPAGTSTTAKRLNW